MFAIYEILCRFIVNSKILLHFLQVSSVCSRAIHCASYTYGVFEIHIRTECKNNYGFHYNQPNAKVNYQA